jgi:hypothetical protein
LTADMQRRICQAVADGNTRTDAATAAGVGRSTLFRWLAKGKRARRGKFRDFWDAIKNNDPLRYQTLALVEIAVEGKLLPPEISARRQGSWLVVYRRM